MVRDKINCVEDWLHSGNVADMGKKSEDESGNSRRCVDIGSGIAQGTGTGKSAIEACQQNIAQGIGLFRTGGARSLAGNKVIGTAGSIGRPLRMIRSTSQINCGWQILHLSRHGQDLYLFMLFL